MKILYIILLAVVMTSCSELRLQSSTKPKTIRTTAYCSSEKDHIRFGTKSAIGTKLKPNHSIAVNWSIFPVGTILKFGGTVYTVEDYGNYIMWDKNPDVPTIDVYQPSNSAMKRWGVRFFDDVEVVAMGSYEKSLEYLKPELRHPQCKLMYEQILSKL